MSTATPIDVPRLIRITTVACAILAGTLVYVHFEPDRETVATDRDDARRELRSDDVVFANLPRLRAEREALRARYARRFAENPEAVFLRDLDATVRRHGVVVISTRAGHATPTAPTDPAGPFGRLALTLELRGTYRDLLATIVELSRGDEIVAVDAPSLRRDGASLVASVPVAIFEPVSR